MKPIRIEYYAAWDDVINVVCPEINEEANAIADLLDEKDIPFEFCVVENEPDYNGKVALVLLGVSGISGVFSGSVESGYVFELNEAIELINDQKHEQLVVNGVDYVQVSELFQKAAVMDAFDAFCRAEYETEVSNCVDDSFPTDDMNDTETVSDKELNPVGDALSCKTELMDAAQHAVYKVYEMYEKAINLLFEKDENRAE